MKESLKTILNELSKGRTEFMINPPELSRQMKVIVLSVRIDVEYKEVLVECVDEGFVVEVVEEVDSFFWFHYY